MVQAISYKHNATLLGKHNITDTTTLQNAPVAQENTAPADDFFSDAPLSVCPMRKDGMGPDETCEAC